jgi:hypothetical protein
MIIHGVDMPRPETRPRSPVLAALASLTMPGLGQLYNGQPLLAAAWAAVYWVVAVLYTLRVFEVLVAPDPAAAITRPLGWLAVMAVLWLGGVVQAVFAALDRPAYVLQPYNRGLVYLGSYLLVYLLLPLLLAFPAARWMMARHGITTPEQRAELLARIRGAAGRSGAEETSVAMPVARPVKVKVDIPNPDSAAAAAVTVFHITLVGGPDGGIYDATSSEPVCTHRTTGGAPSWAGLFTNPGDSTGITAVQFRVPIEEGETNDFQLSLNIGNLPAGRSYVVDGRRPWGENGKGRASVQRRAEGAVIRLDATTPEGARVEAIVQCREVTQE